MGAKVQILNFLMGTVSTTLLLSYQIGQDWYLMIFSTSLEWYEKILLQLNFLSTVNTFRGLRIEEISKERSERIRKGFFILQLGHVSTSLNGKNSFVGGLCAPY